MLVPVFTAQILHQILEPLSERYLAHLKFLLIRLKEAAYYEQKTEAPLSEPKAY